MIHSDGNGKRGASFIQTQKANALLHSSSHGQKDLCWPEPDPFLFSSFGELCFWFCIRKQVIFCWISQNLHIMDWCSEPTR